MAVVAGIWGYRTLDTSSLSYDVRVTPTTIPADGSSSALVEIRIISRFGNDLNARALPFAPQIRLVQGGELVRMVPQGDSLRYRLVPYFESGTVVIRVMIPGAPAPIEARLELTPSLADRNQNGYPDQLDLTSESDRVSFRRWFTTIALGQRVHLDDAWHDRDCAGLLRYCYREALKRHDSAWLARRRWLLTAGIPDVRKYNYPKAPIVGTRIFNAGQRASDSTTEKRHVSRGNHKDPDISAFAEFADASRLKDNSLVFLSRSPDDALPGDLLLYLNDTERTWPYHMMIYLGGGATVYHTGPDGANPGRVKRLTLAELASHPNARWHPVDHNPYFLGYYRWRILA